MTARACGTYGCLDYAAEGSAHCPKHRRIINRPRYQRKNWRRNVAPGDGAARRLRRTILANYDRGILTPCVKCWGTFPPSGIEVDHIQPLTDNGYDVDDNVQPLCLQCHQAKTQHERQHRHQHNDPTPPQNR